jgi:hypothetical protein
MVPAITTISALALTKVHWTQALVPLNGLELIALCVLAHEELHGLMLTLLVVTLKILNAPTKVSAIAALVFAHALMVTLVLLAKEQSAQMIAVVMVHAVVTEISHMTGLLPRLTSWTELPVTSTVSKRVTSHLTKMPGTVVCISVVCAMKVSVELTVL